MVITLFLLQFPPPPPVSKILFENCLIHSRYAINNTNTLKTKQYTKVSIFNLTNANI